MTLFSLKGKAAIITGAGSGIGKAIALLFAQQGAWIAAVDAQAQAAEATIQEVMANGGEGAAFPCDVTHQEEVFAAVSGVQQHLKNKGLTLSILVNNAGIAHVGNIEQTEESDFQKVMDVNVKGVFLFTKATIPYLKTTGGVILNLASIASSVGIPDRFAYSTSKGAVVGLTLSVAKDYIGYGIRCNCISPARVHTPFVDGFIAKNYPGKEEEMFHKLSKTQPIGRMGKPDEIAALALYLCSDEASFITGCDYAIDGGFIRLNN